ncbi:MAG: fatty acid desaturase, partial [Microcystaceae cyanobacterium]
HRENSHLLCDVKTLRIRDLLECSQFLLWDAASNRLVSIASFRQATEAILKPQNRLQLKK